MVSLQYDLALRKLLIMDYKDSVDKEVLVLIHTYSACFPSRDNINALVFVVPV